MNDQDRLAEIAAKVEDRLRSLETNLATISGKQEVIAERVTHVANQVDLLTMARATRVSMIIVAFVSAAVGMFTVSIDHILRFFSAVAGHVGNR